MAMKLPRFSLRNWALLLLLLGATSAICVWQLRLAGDFRIDDAYITFSFAKNLAHGHGPVFSLGERVEGYSNFLWMVLLAVPYLWGADDASAFARVVGLAALLALAWVSYRLARRHARPLLAAAAPLLLLLGTDLFRAIQSALETVPYTLALTTGFFLYLTEDRLATDRRRTSLYPFLAAALIRIDGMIPLAGILAFELLAAWTGRRFSWRAFLRWATIPVAAYVIYFVWRWWYYGMPLPATYYAKQLVNLVPRRGLGYAQAILQDWGLWALAPFVSLALCRWRRPDGVLLLSFLAGYVFYIIQMGGDWMPFQRFWIPALPLVLILFSWGLEDVWRLGERWPIYARAHIAVAILGSLLFCGTRLSAASIDTPEEAGKLQYAEEVIRHTNTELRGDVRFLRPVIRRAGARLVTDYAGIFAVFTDARVIDMWGLCNAAIATRGNADGINPIYGKTCVPCYAEFDPDYFHTVTPLIRQSNSFSSQNDVIQNIFQGPAIDTVIGLRSNFVAGRVTELATGRALWFLERRRPGLDFSPRLASPGLQVDYPFGA